MNSASQSAWLNVLFSQVCWFACVLGAAHNHFYVGAVVTLAVASYSVVHSEDPKNEAYFLALATVAGTLWDLNAVSLGAYFFVVPPAVPWSYPIWMSALWLAFAITVRHSLSWLAGRWYLAGFLGLLGGPLAYSGGAKFGGIVLGEPRGTSLLLIGFLWMCALPGLFWLSESVKGWRTSGVAEGRGSHPFAERSTRCL